MAAPNFFLPHFFIQKCLLFMHARNRRVSDGFFFLGTEGQQTLPRVTLKFLCPWLRRGEIYGVLWPQLRLPLSWEYFRSTVVRHFSSLIAIVGQFKNILASNIREIRSSLGWHKSEFENSSPDCGLSPLTSLFIQQSVALGLTLLPSNKSSPIFSLFPSSGKR